MHASRYLSQLILIALTGALGAACGGDRTATAVLSGASEVPPVTTAASGSTTATLEDNLLTVTGTFTGLESDLFVVGSSSAHVHEAPAGENGPVVFPLAVTSTDQRSGTFSASEVLTEAQRQAFLDSNYYVNVHTVDNPGGEIRGQLDPD